MKILLNNCTLEEQELVNKCAEFGGAAAELAKLAEKLDEELTKLRDKYRRARSAFSDYD